MTARQAHVPAQLGGMYGNSPSWNLEAIVADLPLNTRMERIPVRLRERAADDDAARIEHIDEACDRPTDSQERVVDEPLCNAIPCRRSLRNLLGANPPRRMRSTPSGKPWARTTRRSLAPCACERDA